MISLQTGRVLAGLWLSFFLLALVVACGSAPGTTTASQNPGTAPPGASPTPSATASPTSVAGSDCPAQGHSHAAHMPALAQQGRQEIIYYHNLGDQATLDRFDVQGRTVSSITGLSGGQRIQGAQVSANSQWVLMVVSVGNISELQLVRIDGQFLQTLYCAPGGQQIDSQAQWSPDQKQVIFEQGAGAMPAQLYLMQLAGGPVPVELSTESDALMTITWLDNARVYVALARSEHLYLLDTRKGTGQQLKDMVQVQGLPGEFWTFDTSLDGRNLYVGSQTAALTDNPVSTVKVCGIDGLGARQILQSHTLVITELRVIDASTLLLVSYVRTSTQPRAAYNGLWKIHTDGSGLTRLNTNVDGGTAGALNFFGQYTWSNFARNGKYYTDGLYYGSLSGGPLVRYAAANEGDGNKLVGWAVI